MLLPYMSVVMYNAQYLKNLSEEEILERYDKIIEIADHMIAQDKKKEKVQEYKTKIDGMLVKVVDFSCDMVRTKLGPQLEENPSDLKLAKKIFGFMLNGKCTDDPLWVKAGKIILEKEPDFGIAKAIASKCAANNDFACAEANFLTALSLTEDPEDKADMYLALGGMAADRGQKSKARELYNKALGMDPTKKEAYSRIGYLYYQSFEQCSGKDDIVQDRAVFLAAYDMFERGGNQKMMNSAKEQFPSKEEIFTYNYTTGDNLKVNCWISISTSIRSRD